MRFKTVSVPLQNVSLVETNTVLVLLTAFSFYICKSSCGLYRLYNWWDDRLINFLLLLKAHSSSDNDYNPQLSSPPRQSFSIGGGISCLYH